jgi:hypothetical protein
MKKLSLFIMLGFGVLCAQESKTKWGLMVSPEIKHRLLNFVPSKGFRANENLGLGVSLGLVSIKNILPKTEFEYGVLFVNKGYRTQFERIFGDQIDPINGIIGNPQKVTLKYNYNYLTLPIKLNWYVDDDYFISFGLQPEVLLSANRKTVFPDSKSRTKIGNIKPVNTSFLLSGGKVFNINKFSFRIEPTLQFGLINIHKRTVLAGKESEYLFNVGLATKWFLN